MSDILEIIVRWDGRWCVYVHRYFESENETAVLICLNQQLHRNHLTDKDYTYEASSIGINLSLLSLACFITLYHLNFSFQNPVYLPELVPNPHCVLDAKM